MLKVNMLTVSDAYHPMAPGRNVIRIHSEKYRHVTPGHRVHMQHWTGVRHGRPAGEHLATEEFMVIRVVKGELKYILPEVWQDNHHRPRDLDHMLALLKRHYGGDCIGFETKLIALYT